MTSILFSRVGLHTPRTTSYTASSYHRAPLAPEVVCKRISMTVRALVRQSDPSLSFNWHNDPPREVPDSVQDLLGQGSVSSRPPALPRNNIQYSCTFALVQALSLSLFNKFRPIAYFSAGTTTLAQQLKLLFVRRFFWPAFPQLFPSLLPATCWLRIVPTSCPRILSRPSKPTICLENSFHRSWPSMWHGSLLVRFFLPVSTCCCSYRG